ncbi:unnamed protein product [Strongylus vulgaris]|uniref:Tryptophan synthase beta chain-like PALP domain-containing protein n=1 Tax=Strongylus vulgaris TaxID=40348 RepID=A0A3P7JGZ7_STRVU|nr:unnamed protein product [Strongylus vulgaris]
MQAVERLWREREEMGHTPLIKFQPKGFPNADIFLKNETATKTRTLKHRFAWALVLWAIIDGKIAKELEPEKIEQITSGTISSVGRYTKRYNIPTRIVLADSEFSLFHDYVIYNRFTNESAAAMYVLRERGIGGGASTGLNFLVSLHKAYQLKDAKNNGRLTIVTIICDPGEYYETTYFNPQWIDKLFADAGGMKGLKCWQDVSVFCIKC